MRTRKWGYLALSFIALTGVSLIFLFNFIPKASGPYNSNDPYWNLVMIFFIIMGVGLVGAMVCSRWWSNKRLRGDY